MSWCTVLLCKGVVFGVLGFNGWLFINEGPSAAAVHGDIVVMKTRVPVKPPQQATSSLLFRRIFVLSHERGHC